MKEYKKKFECKNGCKKQYLDLVVLGCDKCIKKVAYPLTEEQEKQICKILTNK